MVICFLWAALRRRPFSLVTTLILVVQYAALLQIPIALAILGWGVLSLVGLELWLALEQTALDARGCHEPTRRERERLEAFAGYLAIPVRVADDPEVWIGSALRTVVISSGALEIFDEQATFGLLAHADVQRRSAWLVRAGCVWLGNLLLLGAWWLGRGIARLGHVLAHVIGGSLVVPVSLSPDRFIPWTRRTLGAILVAWVGALLLASGVTALGLGLLLAWVAVPGLGMLLAWEARCIEADTDRAIVKAGLGQHLLEGIGHPAMLDATPPAGLLRLLVSPSAPRARRINSLERLLDET